VKQKQGMPFGAGHLGGGVAQSGLVRVAVLEGAGVQRRWWKRIWGDVRWTALHVWVSSGWK
jgi:hypothetical protein